MRILLDCRRLSSAPPDRGKRLFILSCAAILAAKRGVEWLFLVDRDDPGVMRVPGAMSGQGGRKEAVSRKDPDDRRYPAVMGSEIGSSLEISRGMRGPIGRWLWVNWRLPRIVKKWGPGLVMSAGDITRVPGAPDERYRPLTGSEKEEVKKRYSEGKEYFLAGAAGAKAEEIMGLLKAFSLFKKRQRSNMQLVLAIGGPMRRRGGGLAGKLANYKYRADVHLCDSPAEEEWRGLVGAAYAFITPLGKEGLGLEMLNAWKAETPVIATDTASLQPLGEEALQPPGERAALYSAPGDPASLAALLMTLYTNEGLRAELVAKAAERVRSFSWERAAGQVWEGILRATDKQ